MEFMTFDETKRALIIWTDLCRRAGDGRAVLIEARDVEIVALGLILAVQACEHAEEAADAISRGN